MNMQREAIRGTKTQYKKKSILANIYEEKNNSTKILKHKYPEAISVSIAMLNSI